MSETFWKTTGGHWAIGGIVAYSIFAFLVFICCATGGCTRKSDPSSGRSQPDIPDWVKEDCFMRFLWILFSFFLGVSWGVVAVGFILVLSLVGIGKFVGILFEGVGKCCGILCCGGREDREKSRDGTAAGRCGSDAEAGQAGNQLEAPVAGPSVSPPPHAAERKAGRVNSANKGAAPPPYSSLP
jgi:hypothetical protein